MNRPLSSIYWLNVGDSSIPFAGVIEQTNFIPPSEYGDKHIVYLFNYLAPDHPWLRESKHAVFARYEEGLKRMFPKYDSSQVEKITVFRDAYATPIYAKNYLKLKPPQVSSKKGLFFANTAHIFPEDRNMNFSVVLANRIADQIARPEIPPSQNT